MNSILTLHYLDYQFGKSKFCTEIGPDFELPGTHFELKSARILAPGPKILCGVCTESCTLPGLVKNLLSLKIETSCPADPRVMVLSLKIINY